MPAIELQHASNVFTHHDGDARQELTFAALVENRAFHKTVTVHWSGDDGAWRTLDGAFVARRGRSRELWVARAQFSRNAGSSLPGNVRFAVRVSMDGLEFWDNHASRDYQIDAGAGVLLGPGHRIAWLDVLSRLPRDHAWIPVSVAVRDHVRPHEVFVTWTDDRWRRAHHTALGLRTGPNPYGVSVYHGRVRARGARHVELAVGCHAVDGSLWDNNDGENHVIVRGLLRVLTLNLHCYQEEDQDAKLSTIARGIVEQGVDVVCLQEVAENWNDGHGDWGSNAARILCERVGGYHVFTDWSHRGFDRYREGVAILSRFPLLRTDSRYVSRSRDPNDIHARRVVMAQVDTPAAGLVNVFSAHLSWWRDGFREQWDTLHAWADLHATEGVHATLLCGDFNVAAGSDGYQHVVGSSDFEDQVLKATRRDVFDAVFRERVPGWPAWLGDDGRIDFVWLRRTSRLRVTEAHPIFTAQDYGRVSDHEGYVATFESA